MRTLALALLGALFLSLFLVAGCDGGNSVAVAPEPSGNYNITVYDQNGEMNIRQWSADTWYAGTGRAYFTLSVAGTRGGPGVPPADFEIWKSFDPADFDDPEADLATFNTLVADIPYGEDPSYQFTALGRYLVRARYAGTDDEIAHVRLVINDY